MGPSSMSHVCMWQDKKHPGKPNLSEHSLFSLERVSKGQAQTDASNIAIGPHDTGKKSPGLPPSETDKQESSIPSKFKS